MNLARLIAMFVIAGTMVGLLSDLSTVVDASPPEEPEGILIWVTVSSRALVGENLTLTITIENDRQDRPFHLADIDVEGSYLKGFAIKAVEPTPVDDYAIDGDETLEYNITIPAQTRQQFYITLRSVNAGVFVGDVDIWGSEEDENGQFCTARAQTRVE